MMIPKQNLPFLKQYKYSAVDQSLASRYLLQPYWQWLVQFLPLWMAPNLVTLIGLGCVGFNVFTLYLLAPDLGPCPPWVYWTFALGLWCYQSLDAIDGKQARRTGTSSPLGQLFDHGCDALNATLGGLIAISSLNLGTSAWAVLSLSCALAAFYVTTWEEYYTGTLFLGYINGPVEGILILITVYIFTGFNGPQWWNQPISAIIPALNINLHLNHAFICFCVFLLVPTFIQSAINISTFLKSKKQSLGDALLNLVPFIEFLLLADGWWFLSPQIQSLTFMWALMIGIAFANIVGRIIVAHVLHMPFPRGHPVFYAWLVGLVNRVSGTYFAKPFFNDEGELVLFYASFLFVCLHHAWFVRAVITEICDYLGIWCLSIKGYDEKKQRK